MTPVKRLAVGTQLWVALLPFALSLAGCSSAVRWGDGAPRPAQTVRPAQGEHVVQAGDTLHSIAFRYGVDVRNLVRWNRMDNPDFLLVGQRVRLSKPPTSAAASAQTTGAQRSSGAGPRPLPPLPQVPAPQWSWPVSGSLVSGYGATDQVGQGITIGGQPGDPVRAAADGQVVYTGSGLIGYGQLVIIKHNATFLSAYGYNESVSVAEGAQVAAGQPIAEMGTGTNGRAQLLFEIRRNGEPVNPLLHLPRR